MRFHDRTKLDIFGNSVSESCVAQSSELDFKPEVEIVPQLPSDPDAWQDTLGLRLGRINDALQSGNRHKAVEEFRDHELTKERWK